MTVKSKKDEPMRHARIIDPKAERLESLINLSNSLRERERRLPINYNDFLFMTSLEPANVLRDIFQLFHDMVHHYVPEGQDDFKVSEQSVGFVQYDFTNLFVTGCDNPFFADRLFSNRFMKLVDGFRKGTQKNIIFLFEGPPGSGKSTFLNNLLQRLEDYAKTAEGATYKVFWRLNLKELGGFRKFEQANKEVVEQVEQLVEDEADLIDNVGNVVYTETRLEFSCPNHDHPILMIPKSYREEFIDELIPDKKIKDRLFSEKQYEWVLRGIPCNICNSLYNSLLDQTGDPLKVYSMIYARKNFFSRQLGEGISVFNPGDEEHKKLLDNPTLQSRLNALFKNEDIRFLSSYLSKTNNGVLALMDIKEHNAQRLRNYHGIISDGVHKVELAEEYINTLFLGLINPADRKQFDDIPSFQDRIINVKIPYVLDFRTEIEIYKDKFGENVESYFLPGVLDNFSKIIISTRLDAESTSIRRWIRHPEIYSKYLDKNLLLLKMDIYAGRVPTWLSDEDVKRFDRQVRLGILDEAKTQGQKGLSGRQSLLVLNRFISMFSEQQKLITMDMLKAFFVQEKDSINAEIPDGFIDSLEDMYDYNVLQQVKEAIYFYNERQLQAEILDYLFAINYEPGTVKKCDYTGNTVEVSEEFYNEFEKIILSPSSTLEKRRDFRKDTHSEYITKALSQEMRVGGKQISDTELYKSLFDKYTRNLKEHSLAPYAGNDNFRRAIADFDSANFNAYDARLKRDVEHMIKNLKSKFNYNVEGARQISLYVVDKDLVNKY